MPVLTDGQIKRFRKGVYDRRADAVKTAGDLISAAAELSARVKDGIGDGRRRDLFLGVDAGRDTAASASSIALSTISLTR